MKATLRVPTREQYAYIEIEDEFKAISDVIKAYADATKLYKESYVEVPFRTDLAPPIDER